MFANERAQTRWAEFSGIRRILPRISTFRPGAPWNPARLLEECARRWPEGRGLAFEDRRYTWSEIDRRVNRTARAFRELGVRRGDSVALLMDNRPEFLFAFTALSRLNARAALINTNISGRALAHALEVGDASRLLVGAEHAERAQEVLPDLRIGRDEILGQADADRVADGFESFDERVEAASDGRLPDVTRPGKADHVGYIYTSGTTGLPKAAIITNARLVMAGALFGRGMLDLGPDDVVYIALPLYHGNGMFGGWGSALHTGACLALRRRFSASRFWADIRSFDATAFVYIGELCRYLLNQPHHVDERSHRLRVAAGNGLRPDIWERFQERFGIPVIREFYGATEGTGAMVNFAGRPGMVGRLMAGSSIVRCDRETGELWRNAEGRAERVDPGETGLLVSRISPIVPYDGYSDEEASRKKILTDVFRSGDRYFNSGDLLTLHEDRWLSFADRVGDTFRWKGENVSTNEVAEILNGAPGVLESNVYGVEVPGAEGRAGMASLNCGPDFSLDRFQAHVVENLPVYQRPYFLRLQSEMRVTGTFKHQKTDYRREGYDPARVADPLYVLDGEKYVPLDADLYAGIQSGRVSLR